MNGSSTMRYPDHNEGGVRSEDQQKQQTNFLAQTCPFLVNCLQHGDNDDGTSDNHSFRRLLPASYRTASNDLAASTSDVTACVQNELDLKRLNAISPWLWIAGRPMPPRPLHHQLVLSRDILITERMDMHLVWTIGRIFIKPIPRFLLTPEVWAEYLSCPLRCKSMQASGLTGYTFKDEHSCSSCVHERLWSSALGFLYSYTGLISHESDFAIAQAKQLIPSEVEWADWMTLVEQILATNDLHQKIDDRFNYGELRLSRLNKIYNVRYFTLLRGYMSHWQWTRYGDFFQENLSWLAATTVYIAVVLGAMQVGLGTDALGGDRKFQSASYGFTIFSILGPLVALGIIGALFCFMFINNWISAVAFKRKRFKAIHSVNGA